MENIRLFFKGVLVDEKIKDYINKKITVIEKITKRQIQTQIEVDLDKKGKFRVEIMVKCPGKLYRSEEISESIEGSFDIALEEIISQIKKTKERIRTLRIRGKRSIKKKAVIAENARI